MRIPVTQTEILAMPGAVRRKYYDFMLNRTADHTPVQRISALCVRYYFGMQGEGHTGFYNYNEDIEKNELKQALIAVGVPEIAENLPDPVEDTAEESYEKPDELFINNEQALYDAIEEYRQCHFDDFFEVIDENYTIRPPKDGFWVGAFITAIVFILGLIAAATNPDPDDRLLFIRIMVIQLALIVVIFLLYSTRWKISVLKNVITLRFLFRKKRVILFDEISSIKTFSKSIKISAHGRRLIKVSKQARGFGVFKAQLDLTEKAVDKQVAGFVVRKPKANIINGFIWPLICIYALIWTFTRQANPANIFEKMFFTAALLVSLYYLTCCLRWKVTAADVSIRVKKAFRAETEYMLCDITRVDIDNHSAVKTGSQNQKMHIFVNNKETVKIAADCEGFQELSVKLQNANIPFYRNGKRWRYETIPIVELLEILSNFEIRPKHDDFVEWMSREWGSDQVRADPYELLMVLGTSRKDGALWERLSDDVFFMSAECVDDSDSYRIILERLAALSKGAFCIANLQSEVDSGKKKASVSFEYCNTDCRWDLEYDADLFDLSLIRKINSLLMNNGSTDFFFISEPPFEEGYIIVFSSEKIINELNLMTDFSFSVEWAE